MPKLDPNDIDQPTTADIAAANAGTPAQTAPVPSPMASKAPSLFGGSNATTNSTPTSGGSAFGAPAAGGFGSSGSFGSPNTSFGGSSFGGSSGGFGGSSFGGGMGGNMPQQQIAADPNTTAAFGQLMNSQAGHEPEHWMKAFWRPAMGWLYMLICFMDFVAFPMISMFLPIIERAFGIQMGYTAWQSLTLSNGGLIHLAFGGILGVSAFGRTQEKKAGAV
jgi:hypothetical protein